MTTTLEPTIDLSIDQLLQIPVQLDAAAFQRLPESWPTKQMPPHVGVTIDDSRPAST